MFSKILFRKKDISAEITARSFFILGYLLESYAKLTGPKLIRLWIEILWFHHEKCLCCKLLRA